MLLSLCLFRAIKLVGDDRILDGPRDWVSDHLPARFADRYDYLVSCPWCLGPWLGTPIWIAWIIWPMWTLAACAYLAFLAAAALVFSLWNAVAE